MPTTSTVTGKLQNLDGTAATGGRVTFYLQGHTDQTPRVIGTTQVVQPLTVALPDGSGNISVALWGNDNIEPAGTFYRVTVQSDTQGSPGGSLNFNITGASFDLNTATPIS